MDLEVAVRRGPVTESRHRFEVAVVDGAGRLIAASAEPDLLCTFRSSAKPFQALPLVERGHADRWGFSEEQIAIMCASHTGSARHRDVVTGILEIIGCTVNDLACGMHPPKDPAARTEWESHPDRQSALFNNCSGKHAGMLALALAEGWETHGYEQPDHPVQQLVRRTIADVTGTPAADLIPVIDGCSVVSFGLPLRGMARAFQLLATASPAAGARGTALARIRDAMTSHPELVGGEGELSTTLMRAAPGRIVAKGGAEGLECIGVTDRGIGIALKCMDGGPRAMGPAAVTVLQQQDLLDDDEAEKLAATARPVQKNHAGIEVGVLTAEIRQQLVGEPL